MPLGGGGVQEFRQFWNGRPDSQGHLSLPLIIGHDLRRQDHQVQPLAPSKVIIFCFCILCRNRPWSSRKGLVVNPQHILAVLPPMGPSTAVAAERPAQDTTQGSMPMRRPVRPSPAPKRTTSAGPPSPPTPRPARSPSGGPASSWLSVTAAGPPRPCAAPACPGPPPSRSTIRRPRDRVLAEGVDGLWRDATRPPGRKPIPAATVRAIIDLAMAPPPPHRSSWTPGF